MIVAMTELNGLLYSHICDQAIDSESFTQFLKGLRRKMGRKRIALFMDQLRVHKARSVVEIYDKLDIIPVFNVGYSPEFNPIEAVFSKIKY